MRRRTNEQAGYTPQPRRVRVPSGVRRALAFVCLLAGTFTGAGALSFWDETPDAILREQLLDAMTPEELI
ncbi:MAG TPA: hypothetical protein VKA06_10245, partial [Spirochaetia bacterium]|nr:hypothetical protein [Spirochaetia bacterium]